MLPLLPAQERQLQSYAGTLKSFKDDLSYLQENLPEGKRAKAKELEEHRVRAEYLHHEVTGAPGVNVCVPVLRNSPLNDPVFR